MQPLVAALLEEDTPETGSTHSRYCFCPLIRTSMYISFIEMTSRQRGVNLSRELSSCVCGLLYALFYDCSLTEVDHFKRVLHHEAFKNNPLSAINEHVTYSVTMSIL